jgi:hypothetical protein
MNQMNATLSSQVFGPSRRAESGMRSQAEGIIERLTVYVWPKGVSDADKLAVLCYLPAHGRSVEESPSDWATWMFTYICLCFPEMQQSIESVGTREYEFKKLPQTYITSLVNLARNAEEYDEHSNAEATYSAAARAIVPPPGFPGLPGSQDNYLPDYSAGRVVPVVYGYCSLLIYLCGKKITEKNVTAIAEKRPQNLMATYLLDEVAAFCLIGAGRMETTAHTYLNQAWVTYAAARQGIIKEVAAFSHGASLPQRVVFTVSKMIEYSGMQPAYYIHKFLLAMPQAAEYSCMKAAINAYVVSLREVAAAPAHIQPYYKVIHGDLTRAFHRNHILMLSACAVAYEKYTSPTMKNFNLGEGAEIAVNMFDAEAVRRGETTLQELAFHDEQDAE